MALVTTDGQSEKRGIVIYNSGQRQLALRVARRHSFFVRALRLLLPASAMALLTFYGVFLQAGTSRTIDTRYGKFTVDSVDLLATRPTMRNPTYRGVNDKDGSEFSVKAERAITDLDETKPIDLFGVAGRLTQRDGTLTQLTAKEGKFNRSDSTLFLKNDIVVRTSNGMAARLSTATVKTREGIISSDTPVAVRFPAGTLRGNTMRVHQKTRDIFFAKGVIARLTPQKQSKPGRTANTRGQPQNSPIAAFAGTSDQPVFVRAPKLHVKDATSTAQFSSGVTATQGEAQLEAAILDVEYASNGRESQLSGAGSSVSKIFARNNVVITRGSDRITTSLATFDVEKNTTELSGDVVITSGPDRRIMSERVSIDNKTEVVLLTGQVTATQDGNILRGSRLQFDQRQRRFQLTNPATANGRIKVELANSGQQPGGEKPAPRATKGAGSIIPTQSFRADGGSPIVIEALRLDIDDNRRIAVFSGDVHAVQGEFKIKTEVLHVTYTGSASFGLDANDRNTGKSATEATKLQEIRAPGRVVVESTSGQYAAGDGGRFNMARNEIKLAGNVLLKRGRQLVRGERLSINMTNGLTRIETGGSKAWQPVGSKPKITSAQPGKTVDKKMIANPDDKQACGGRMCAMFFPGDLSKNKGKPAATSSAPPAAVKLQKKGTSIGNSWSAATNPGEN